MTTWNDSTEGATNWDAETFEKTIYEGTPIGLLLALTYSETFVVTSPWSDDSESNVNWNNTSENISSWTDSTEQQVNWI